MNRRVLMLLAGGLLVAASLFLLRPRPAPLDPPIDQEKLERFMEAYRERQRRAEDAVRRTQYERD